MWADVMKMHVHFGPAGMHFNVYEMKIHMHFTTTGQNQASLTLPICVHFSPNAYAFSQNAYAFSGVFFLEGGAQNTCPSIDGQPLRGPRGATYGRVVPLSPCAVAGGWAWPASARRRRCIFSLS